MAVFAKRVSKFSPRWWCPWKTTLPMPLHADVPTDGITCEKSSFFVEMQTTVQSVGCCQHMQQQTEYIETEFENSVKIALNAEETVDHIDVHGCFIHVHVTWSNQYPTAPSMF